jgi:hypothetical protein
MNVRDAERDLFAELDMRTLIADPRPVRSGRA